MESKLNIEIEHNTYYRINWIYIVRVIRNWIIEYFKIAYIFYITGKTKLKINYRILKEKTKPSIEKFKEECVYWWEEYCKWWNKTVNKKEEL